MIKVNCTNIKTNENFQRVFNKPKQAVDFLFSFYYSKNYNIIVDCDSKWEKKVLEKAGF